MVLKLGMMKLQECAIKIQEWTTTTTVSMKKNRNKTFDANFDDTNSYNYYPNHNDEDYFEENVKHGDDHDEQEDGEDDNVEDEDLDNKKMT